MNLKKGFKRLKQDGISLLEVMLSLSIIAIILVMATRYFFTASESQKVNQAKAEVTAVVAATTSYGHNNSNFTGVNVGKLMTNGYLHSSPSISGTGDDAVFNNPWKNAIALAPTGTGDSQLTITTTTASARACNALKSSFPSGACGGTNNVDFSITVG